MPSLVPKTNSVAGSAAAPNAGLLVQGELAENKSTGRLYMKTESNSVVDPARVVLTGDVTGTTSVATSENQAGTIVATIQVVPVAKGGTGSQNPTAARTALGAAASGANSDITSVALTATSTSSATPTNANDIVNKAYADAIASGINFHDACDYATITDLSPVALYQGATGTGVGAKLTGLTNGALVVDGVTAAAGKRILVKNQTTSYQNGVYTVTQQGTGSLPYILTRATDYDTSGSGTNEVQAGDFILVLGGNTLANTAWVQQTQGTIVWGTTSIAFTQFAAITGVTTFSGGTTGLTPSTAQNGAIVLAGTLDVNNGGTGAVTFTSGALLKGAGTAAITTATSGTDYVAGADASSYRATTVAELNLSPTVAAATQLTFAAGVQPALDGHTIALNDILLLTAQTDDAQNGPWVVTRVGTISLGMILQRPVWFSTLTARSGIFVSVSNGVGYQGTVWMVYSYMSYNTGILLGTDSLVAMIIASKNGLPFTSGGTGQRSRQDALNALAGGSGAIFGSQDQALISDGTNVGFAPINLYSPTAISGVLQVANGGTGATSVENFTANLNFGARVIEAHTIANVVGTMNTGVTPNTFTVTATGVFTADGYTPVLNDIVSFTTNTGIQCGFWKVKIVGAIGIQAVFERPSWFSGTAKNTIALSRFGTSQNGSLYLYCGPQTNADISVGTTSISVTRIGSRTANAVTGANTFTGKQTLLGGTATVSPLQFQTGVKLTTPVAHSVEWDGTNMSLTNSASTRRRVAFDGSWLYDTATGLTGIYQFDAATYSGAAFTATMTGATTLNIRGDSAKTLASLLEIGQSINITVIVKSGITSYALSITIDGSAPTIITPTAPTHAGFSYYKHDWTIIKTGASAFVVIASPQSYA